MQMKKYPFTREEMEKIYQTSIIDFAMENGLELENGGRKAFHVKNSGGLYLFRNGRGYYWFTQEGYGGGKGNIVDFAMEYFRLGKREAMEKILGCRAAPQVYIDTDIEDEKSFQLPPRDQDNNRVIAYLVNARKLHPEIVLEMLRQNRIYQSRTEKNGKRYINCAFVGFDKGGKASYCSLRGPSSTSNYKMDVCGSQKETGFVIPGASGHVYVFESPIDALSHASMAALKGEDWTKDYRLSQGGLSTRALQYFLDSHPDIFHITLCYDNDQEGRLPDGTLCNFGQEAALKAKKQYEKLGYLVEIETPIQKDVNLDLCSMVEGMEKAYMERTQEMECER